MEVSLLSQHLALPRAGHQEGIFHILSQLIFDPTDSFPMTPKFSKPEWSDIYEDIVDKLPSHVSSPAGNVVNRKQLCLC